MALRAAKGDQDAEVGQASWPVRTGLEAGPTERRVLNGARTQTLQRSTNHCSPTRLGTGRDEGVPRGPGGPPHKIA